MTSADLPEPAAPGLARRPDGPVDLPEAVARIAGTERVEVVWRNELGGLTFLVGGGEQLRYVKWNRFGSGLTLAPEIERLRWAAPFTSVPEVIEAGSDSEGEWFVSRPLPGTNAVSDRWRSDPDRAVVGIGTGLRRLHEALPVESCPFDWSIDDRLSRIDPAGRESQAGWSDEFGALTVDEALGELAEPPTVDRLVVCHGDACAPNTILDEDGTVSGHVDLGTLGRADRWADLAIATWSTVWNYGPGWEDRLLDAYGIEADPPRIRWYRLLWSMT